MINPRMNLADIEKRITDLNYRKTHTEKEIKQCVPPADISLRGRRKNSLKGTIAAINREIEELTMLKAKKVAEKIEKEKIQK